MALLLNGFNVNFSSNEFTAYTLPVPDPSDLDEIRSPLKGQWFTFWRDGILYGIPLFQDVKVPFGHETKLSLNNHSILHLVCARIRDRLPHCFPKYNALSHRPFSFIAQKHEIVRIIKSHLNVNNPLLDKFSIRPKYELDPRIVELRNGELQIILTLSVRTKWEISASLSELKSAGIDLNGLYVIRKYFIKGQKRLVGRIANLSNGSVILSEKTIEEDNINEEEVYLEGSIESFKRCLDILIGKHYRNFQELRFVEEGNILTGPGYQESISKMKDFFDNQVGVVKLTDDLSFEISNQVEFLNDQNFTSYIQLNSSNYCFNPAMTKTSQYAWKGLEQYGPYDKDSFPKKTPKILVISPDTASGIVGQAIKMLKDGIQAQGCNSFNKGFSSTFNLVNPQFITLTIPILKDRSLAPSQNYRSSIEDHLARCSDYDIALIIILDEHKAMPDDINPYLISKAILLSNGIPAQEVRRSTLQTNQTSLQYTLQNISIALYAKMGGIPWTVSHGLTVDDEIVIGMGNAELSGSRFEANQRHIGITTVFRGDGNYLLANLSKECKYEEYPQVLKTSMISLLKEIKTRNNWQDGDTVRIVFHCFKPLKNIEIASIVKSCIDEVGNNQNIEFAFLTITVAHPFKISDTTYSGYQKYGKTKAVFVPQRGIVSQLGSHTRLLTINGPSLIKRETTPLPAPLLIHLHPDSTYNDLTYLSDQVLKFTCLSWRSTSPAKKPVTIYYSELIANLLARFRSISDWSPAVLNTKLKTSKWFL